MGKRWADDGQAKNKRLSKYVSDLRLFGADDGIRTRDPHLGKVMLYQLSHVRMHLGALRTVADPAAGANSEPHFAQIRHASILVETPLRYGRNMTVPAHDSVPYDTDIAQGAALMADPTRAAMLRALLSDRPLAAGELARLAGVSAATASFHLAKLLDGNMITAGPP